MRLNHERLQFNAFDVRCINGNLKPLTLDQKIPMFYQQNERVFFGGRLIIMCSASREKNNRVCVVLSSLLLQMCEVEVNGIRSWMVFITLYQRKFVALRFKCLQIFVSNGSMLFNYYSDYAYHWLCLSSSPSIMSHPSTRPNFIIMELCICCRKESG